MCVQDCMLGWVFLSIQSWVRDVRGKIGDQTKFLRVRYHLKKKKSNYFKENNYWALYWEGLPSCQWEGPTLTKMKPYFVMENI